MLRIISPLFALSLCVACSDDRAPNSDVITQTGCYSPGFEGNLFIPTPPGNTEAWWVASVPDSLMPQLRALAGSKMDESGHFKVTLKIRGTLSKPGHYGHLGIASHEVRIVEFSDMQPVKDQREGCPMLFDLSLPSEASQSPDARQ
jgi:hypothetical protein